MAISIRNTFFFLVASLATNAEARFFYQDADEIDQESRLSTEYYNDKLAYRYSYPWQRRWLLRNNGFRINAGSVDINRFDYQEEIKFRGGSWMSLDFKRKVTQDLGTDQRVNELQLQVNPLWGFYFGILGQSDSYKKFGDLGASFGYRLNRISYFEIYGVSVDHYYNTKEDVIGNKYQKQPISKGVRLVFVPSPWLDINFFQEIDSPTEWQRESAGTIYRYERVYRRGQSHLKLGLLVLGFEFEFEKKDESRQIVEPGTTDPGLSLERTTMSMLGEFYVFTAGRSYLNLGVNSVSRDAKYEPQQIDLDPSGEELEQSTVRKDSSGFFLYRFAGFRHALIVGLLGTKVVIDSADKTTKANEVKLQTSYEYVHGRMSMLLNANWDMDKLQQAYPFEDAPFQPWDGGNMQFSLAF